MTRGKIRRCDFFQLRLPDKYNIDYRKESLKIERLGSEIRRGNKYSQSSSLYTSPFSSSSPLPIQPIYLVLTGSMPAPDIGVGKPESLLRLK